MYAVVLAAVAIAGEAAPQGPLGILSPRGQRYGTPYTAPVQRYQYVPAYGSGCNGGEAVRYYQMPVAEGCNGQEAKPGIQAPKSPPSDLKKKIDALERRIRELEGLAEEPAPKAAVECGVTIRNEWDRDIAFVVNGKVYVLKPGWQQRLYFEPGQPVEWQAHAFNATPVSGERVVEYGKMAILSAGR